MAAVCAAQDETGATAAVKILHPEMSLNAEVRERFFREAYAANRVGHPGAVSVLDHGREDGKVAYLVMLGVRLRQQSVSSHLTVPRRALRLG